MLVSYAPRVCNRNLEIRIAGNMAPLVACNNSRKQYTDGEKSKEAGVRFVCQTMAYLELTV